jgi:hypothetical protein
MNRATRLHLDGPSRGTLSIRCDADFVRAIEFAMMYGIAFPTDGLGIPVATKAIEIISFEVRRDLMEITTFGSPTREYAHLDEYEIEVAFIDAS